MAIEPTKQTSNNIIDNVVDYNVLFTFTAMGKTIEVPNELNPQKAESLNSLLQAIAEHLPEVGGLKPSGVRIVEADAPEISRPMTDEEIDEELEEEELDEEFEDDDDDDWDDDDDYDLDDDDF